MADQSSPRIDYYYKMNHKNRGIALIFNHETFYDFNMPPRKGTNVDRDRLHQTFSGLGFDVHVHDNRTEIEIRNILQNGKNLHNFYHTKFSKHYYYF